MDKNGLRRRTTTPPSKTEELWSHHYERMVRVATGVLRRRDLAEEAASEAFLRFIARECAPASGREGAYLRSMARNEALAMLRRSKVEERVLPTAYPQARTAEDEAIERMTVVGLGKLIQVLPERQRQVFVHRHVRGASVDEAAGRLGVSAGSIKTHSHRARLALRDAIESQARVA